MGMPKLIIHDGCDYILAVRTAKRLISDDVKSIILVFENGMTFYAARNKSGTITVRQQVSA